MISRGDVKEAAKKSGYAKMQEMWENQRRADICSTSGQEWSLN